MDVGLTESNERGGGGFAVAGARTVDSAFCSRVVRGSHTLGPLEPTGSSHTLDTPRRNVLFRYRPRFQLTA